MRYTYDARGRLARVTGSDGTVRRYTYTDLDELETIEEPTASITNRWEGGRCVRQVNWYEDGDPHLRVWAYQAEGKKVHRTRVSESSGHWREYAWNARGVSISETIGQTGSEPAFACMTATTSPGAVTSMTISCKDREGRPLRRTTSVRPGEEELLKRALVQTSAPKPRPDVLVVVEDVIGSHVVFTSTSRSNTALPASRIRSGCSSAPMKLT